MSEGRYTIDETIYIYHSVVVNFKYYESLPNGAFDWDNVENSIFIKKLYKDYTDAEYGRGLKPIINKLLHKNGNEIVPLFSSNKKSIFYRGDKYRKKDLLNFTGCTAVINFFENQLKERGCLFLDNFLNSYCGVKNDIWKNILDYYGGNLIDSYFEVYILLKSNKAYYDDNGSLNLVSEKVDETKLKEKESMSVDDRLLELNRLREKNGEFYGFNDNDEEPCIKFSNDGTGIGKSYSVIDQFINKSSDIRKSLIFTAPQKNQLTIDEGLAEIAVNKGIRIVQQMSIGDLFDVDSVNMSNRAKKKTDSQANYLDSLVFGKNYKKNKNKNKLLSDVKELLKRLSLKLSDLKKSKDLIEKDTKDISYELDRLRGVQYELKSLNSFIKDVGDDRDKKEIERKIEELKTGLKYRQNYLQKAFVKFFISLANMIYQEKSLGIDFLYQWHEEDRVNKSCLDLIDLFEMFFAFDVSKYKKVIILTTSDKFKYSVFTMQLKKGKYRSTAIKSDSLIGCKLDYITDNDKFVDAGDDIDYIDGMESMGFNSKLSASEEEKSDLIRERFLTIDEDSDFYKKGISFHVVIDEEHEAYKKFNKDTLNTLITKNNNIEHIISAAARMHYSKDEKSVNSVFGANIEKGVLKHLKKVSGYDDITIEDARKIIKNVFGMFQNNNSGMFINASDINMIQNITRNNFIFSENKSFYQEYLRHIKLKNESLGKVVMYYDNNFSLGVNDINLFSISSVIVGILYAIINVGYTDEERNFVELTRLEMEQNQNSSLFTLLNKRKDLGSGAIADALFSERTFDNFEIDYFYVYFVNKLFLNLTTFDDLGKGVAVGKNNNLFSGDIRVRLSIETITYPPEVSMLKILSGTSNKVITLSATSGMLGCKGGNYDRDFFNYYSDCFGYNVIDKSKTNNYLPKLIREERAKIRHSINVEFFDDDFINNELKKNGGSKPLFNLGESAVKQSVKGLGYDELLRLLKIELRGEGFEKNHYHKKSNSRSIKFLELAIERGENSFLLNHRKAFVDAGQNIIKHLKNKYKGLGSNNDCYVIKFNHNNKQCKIIFYNTDIAKRNPEWEKGLFIESDKGEYVIFVSYIKAAGTGVNIFIKDINSGKKRDFDNKILIDNPFYSSINEDGYNFNTTQNNFLLLRKIAAKNAAASIFEEKIKIDVFKSPYLLNLQFNDYLSKEHNLSRLKEIMQAIGRIERTDNNSFSNLFLNNDNASDLYQIAKELRDENVDYFNGISLLNYSYLSNLISYVEDFKLDDDKIIELNNQYIDVVQYFDDRDNKRGYINSVLIPARNGCRKAIEFNRLLRSKSAFKDINKYISDLRLSDYFKNCSFKEYLENIINSFYFDMPHDSILFQNKKIVYGGIYNINKYIESKRDNYNAKEFIIADPRYASNSDFSPVLKLKQWYENGEKDEMVRAVLDKNMPEINKVINPAFYPLLKGSFAENILDDSLNYILSNYSLSDDEIPFKELTVEDVLAIDSKIYEMFDKYIVSGNRFIMVDVKSYSDLTIMGKPLKEEFSKQEKLKQVESIVKSMPEYRGMEFIAVYLNVTGGLKDGVEMNNLSNEKIYNSTFFGTKEFYVEKYKKLKGLNGVKEDKKQNNDENMVRIGTRVSKIIVVSRAFLRLLGVNR